MYGRNDIPEPFFDGIPYHQPLYKYIFVLPKSMHSIVCLRLRCEIPREIHADDCSALEVVNED